MNTDSLAIFIFCLSGLGSDALGHKAKRSTQVAGNAIVGTIASGAPRNAFS